MTTEGDDVALCIRVFDGKITIIATSTNEGTRAPNLSDEVVRLVFGVSRGFTRNTRFSDMDVSQVRELLADTCDEVRVQRNRVVDSNI